MALIGSRLPLPDCSAATAEASCTASAGDRLVIEVPNRMRDSNSSCGNCGTEVKAISGSKPRPAHRHRRVEPLDLGLGANVEQRIGRAFAAETDDPALQPETATGKFVIAADQVGAAVEARRRDVAADREVGGPAAVDAEPAHVKIAARHLHVERPRGEVGDLDHILGVAPDMAHLQPRDAGGGARLAQA